MANDVLQEEGTQILFRASTGFSPTARNDLEAGTPTTVDFDPNGLAAGAGHNSDKADLGAKRAAAYGVMATFDFVSAPTVGTAVKVYWAPSPITTAGTANPGDVDGTDGAYAPYGGTPTDEESAAQLQFIGSFIVVDSTTTQTAWIGRLEPTHRFGTLVIINDTNVALTSSAAEHHVVFDPIVDEIQ